MLASAKKVHHAQLTKPRRGVFMLELILILPIILLVLSILYQVSVMMTTYQTLRMACFNASTACAKGLDVETALKNSIQGYYFGGITVTRADSSTWTSEKTPTTSQIKYRILKQTGTAEIPTWEYFTDTSVPASGDTFAVEIKLEVAEADDVFKSYWLLRNFAGVDTTGSNSMTLSQVSAR